MLKSTITRYTNLAKTIEPLTITVNKLSTIVTTLTNRITALKKKALTHPQLKKNITEQIQSIKSKLRYPKFDLKFNTQQLLTATNAQQKLNDENQKNIEIKKNQLLVASNTVVISQEINSDYTIYTHGIQLKKMQSRHPNCLYTQTVKYSGNRPLISDTFEIVNITKENIIAIELKMSIGGYNEWIPAMYIGLDDEHESDRNLKKNNYVEITTNAYQKIPYLANFDSTQIYKDNVNNNCVLDGIIKYLEKKTCKRGKTCHKKLMKIYDTYSGGVTETQIAEICDIIKCSVNIIDPIKAVNKTIGSSPFNFFKIDFYNTRFNHLEQINHTHDNLIELTADNYANKKIESNYYIESFGKLFTIDGTYKKQTNDFKIMHDEWLTNNKLNEKFIVVQSDAWDMIKNYHFNVHSFFDNKMSMSDNLYEELDCKKAYYNYSNPQINTRYKGVPSGAFVNFKCINYTIENFNECVLIGFYQVRIIKIMSNIDIIINKFGFKLNSIHTLSTSNIELLKTYIEFEFMNASVSPSCHIPFDPKSLLPYNNVTGKQEAGGKDLIKGYCKIYGIMMRDDGNTPTCTIKCQSDDARYYNMINDETYNMYMDEKHILKIFNRNITLNSYIHITHTIHAYLMTMMFEQMLKIDHRMIVGIKLDSIVVRKGTNIEYNDNVFAMKEGKVRSLLRYGGSTADGRFAISSYFSPMKVQQSFIELSFKQIFTENLQYITKNVSICGGAGGTGKTHSIFNFFDNKHICYSTNGWNLINGKRTEFKGTIGLSIQKLTGFNINKLGKKEACERIENKNIKTIVLDEATMLNLEYIDAVVKLYPHALIFILGDIDYDGYSFQCNVNNKVINPSKYPTFQYIKYTKTYRFNDELNEKLAQLREFQKDHKDDRNANMVIHNYVKKNWGQCFKNKEDVIYNNIDVGISAIDDYTNNENKLSKYFIDKGTTGKYFIKTTNLNKNLMRGQELTEKPNHDNYEEKLFKTIHSFQGLQCTHENKIIISVTRQFNYELYYTAFSRARRLDQIIVLI